MYEFDKLISSIDSQVTTDQRDTEIVYNPSSPSYFDINRFIDNIRKKSLEENRAYFENSHFINAYDITSSCIRQTVYRLLKVPVVIKEDVWLPVSFRAKLGKAIHDFIQSNYEFTEVEISMRVPSIRISLRIDALINNNVLVEIKSLPFKDYIKVVKTKTPRISDFKQMVLYKYILENYLSEIKQTPVSNNKVKPKLDNYNIQYFQLIYVAHDVLSSDFSTYSEMMKYISNFKKIVDSRHNQFFFISSLDFDLSSLNLESYVSEIVEKISEINKFVSSNKIPPINHKFIDKKQCYFCQFSQICSKDS